MLQKHQRSNLRVYDLPIKTIDLHRNTGNTRRSNGEAKAVPSEMSTMQMLCERWTTMQTLQQN
jgi:hypothetical protein